MMSDQIVSFQPYPGIRPWVLLSEYVTNGWQAGNELSSFNLMGKIDYNEVHLKLRTRRGTNRSITEQLPAAFCPVAQQVLPISATGYPDMQVIIETTGRIQLFSGSGAHNDAADGSLLNAVLHCSYLRSGT